MFKSCGFSAGNFWFSLFGLLPCGLTSGFSSVCTCLFRVFINRYFPVLTSLNRSFTMFFWLLTINKTLKYKLGVA